MCIELDSSLHVAILGGGFSGSLLAIQLLRRVPDLRVTVIDQGSRPGRGLAYSTEHARHLLNVPADGMSAFPDEPHHFLEWSRRNHSAATGACDFLPRALFGKYIESLLDLSLQNSEVRSFQWVKDEAVSLQVATPGIRICLKSGAELKSQTVVLATGNNDVSKLKIAGLDGPSPRYISSPWSSSALEGIPRSAEILFIGSGLTSVDLAVALASDGFMGRIHFLSRHGLLPQVHRNGGAARAFRPRNQGIRALMRQVRSEIRSAGEGGADWRDVIDSLRPSTQTMWQSLSLAEKRRFLRHVRPFWEVHRHRMAPDVGAVVARLLAEGSIQIHAGRVTRWEEQESHVNVQFRDRRSGAESVLRVDRVINCTGPECDFRRVQAPLIRNLFEQGLARPDSLFLGLDVDEHGALVDANGQPSSSLFAVGPPRKGRNWESTAVPELRVQAAELAATLMSRFRPAWGLRELTHA